ncbi:hypothetical protein PENSPDRAFT_263727 [Peniophora sp. CONT]|nr:hypothetical protein PENSPDRAFT_263727 [Peniophora sp. CONT]
MWGACSARAVLALVPRLRRRRLKSWRGLATGVKHLTTDRRRQARISRIHLCSLCAFLLHTPPSKAAAPAVPTLVSLFMPFFVGTSYSSGMGGGVGVGSILRLAHRSAVWAGRKPGTHIERGYARMETAERREERRDRTGAIASNDVDREILEWYFFTKPTTNAMRDTSRGTLMRCRVDGDVRDAPVARRASGEGWVYGWVCRLSLVGQGKRVSSGSRMSTTTATTLKKLRSLSCRGYSTPDPALHQSRARLSLCSANEPC